MNTSSQSFKLKYASLSDFDEIMGFYTEDPLRRTKGVYIRNPEIIRSHIGRKLVLAVCNEQDKIVASSALYSLNEGNAIDCIGAKGDEIAESGRVVELGSVLRMGRGQNDAPLPVGIWNVLLFGVPMVMAFDRAGELPNDILVSDVQTDLTNTINHITGAPSTKSPMRWELIKPAQELIEAFTSTTEDENIRNPKNFYRASIHNLPDITKFLKRSSQDGFIVNHKRDMIRIDFSELELDDVMDRIIKFSWNFKNRFMHNASWSEARRTLNAATPSDQPPAGRPSLRRYENTQRLSAGGG